MTLILTTLTEDYILQASDRRISFSSGGTRDDSTIKSVLWDNHSIYGYTGLAELPRSEKYAAEFGVSSQTVDTGQWLAEVIALCSRGLSTLQEEANKSFQKLRRIAPENKTLIVMTGSWEIGTGSEVPHPCLFVTCNTSPRGDFRSDAYHLDYEKKYLALFSRDVDNSAMVENSRRMKRCIQSGGDPGAISRIMVEAIRAAADKDSSKTIGHDINVTCLPRKQVEAARNGKEWGIDDLPINSEKVSVNLFNATNASNQGRVSSPIIVIGSRVVGRINITNGGRFIVRPK